MRFKTFFELSLAVSLVLAGCELIVDTSKPGTGGGDGDDGTEQDTDPSDDPCSGVRCGQGMHCEAQQDECITTPCKPIAACVGDDDGATCAVTLCMQGTVCVEGDRGAMCVPQDENPCDDIDCIASAVCEIQDGKAVCVPIDEPMACGEATCAAGEVCCNPSCGICTAPDGQCITVTCDPGATCAVLFCGPNEFCEETPSGAQCVPNADDPCNDVDCDDGLHCELDEGAAVCVPSEGDTCETRDCPRDTYCDDRFGKAECIPLPSCDDVNCGKGKHCELQDVACVQEPCPDEPVCVSDDPCADVDCQPGWHCEEVPVDCIQSPCPPQTECVKDDLFGQRCGHDVCGLGEWCCNPSCSLCVPTGQFCTDQICEQGNGPGNSGN